jgi:hypothetical protein
MALLQQPFQTVAKLRLGNFTRVGGAHPDLLLAARYGRDSVEDKAENKRQLQIAMGLKVNDSGLQICSSTPFRMPDRRPSRWRCCSSPSRP